MERIYPPRNKAKFKIKDHMKEFMDILPVKNATMFPETEKDIQKLMDLQDDDVKFFSLMDSIDMAQMACPQDIPVEPFDPTKPIYTRAVGISVEIPKEALKLNTIQARVNKSQNANSRIDEKKARHSRHRRLNTDLGSIADVDLVPFEETVISLRFYQPYKYEPENTAFEISFCQEFLVLGSQTLSELRPKIFCSASSGPFPEISENPNAERPALDDEAAFFFITDTFYNDFSRPYVKDYSSPIVEWAKGIEEIDELKSAAMDEMKFEDLTVRIGYPQLYQHYGNCEHIFVFSDVKLLQPSDILQRSQYPFLRTVSNNRRHICYICGVNPVKYLVQGCKRQITDPTFYCATCFDAYLYNEGEKIGNFEAFNYAENRPPTH
ncbi:snRNA-activating protein complex subunit 3 [Phlebotomus argentipes]|uniref:snRNA-activating protein complex subunit 3 n=1 Tax=Phlebotomus argentipes TaxID=94469 RepID=UPI0028937ABD|nr:snRNA-activating protein complex subunit 3 [Phlebotomus argentipes]